MQCALKCEYIWDDSTLFTFKCNVKYQLDSVAHANTICHCFFVETLTKIVQRWKQFERRHITQILHMVNKINVFIPDSLVCFSGCSFQCIADIRVGMLVGYSALKDDTKGLRIATLSCNQKRFLCSQNVKASWTYYR